jgi:PAS domain S-box-containing protein
MSDNIAKYDSRIGNVQTGMNDPSQEPSDDSKSVKQFPSDKVGTWLSAVLESSMDGVIVIDASGRIVLLNGEANRMFGYTAEEILRKPMETLLPPRLRTEHRLQLKRFTAPRMSGRRLRVRLDLIGLRANGEEFVIEASIARVTVKEEIFLAVIIRELPQDIHGNSALVSENNDLRKLAVSSQQASEIEKRRFSKELYDELGQRLSVLKLDLDWLENNISETVETVPERISQMQRLLNNVIARTKNIASTLRPPLLDDFGLLPALEWITDNFHKKTSILCTIESEGIKIKTGDPIESVIFRVVQESLLNVERHAHATEVHILLQQDSEKLDIVIEDNGVGMAISNENKPGCFGLIAMQERIYILGGTISAKNVIPHGFSISASIPVK